MLSYLIKLFTSGKNDVDTINEMYISGSILIAISIITIFLNHHSLNEQMMIGMRMRVAVCSLVYRKVKCPTKIQLETIFIHVLCLQILKLNKKALGETASGQVVNLLSNDVNRFDMVIVALHHLWISPFLISVCAFWMWQEVGIAALAGVGSMVVLTLPLQCKSL